MSKEIGVITVAIKPDISQFRRMAARSFDLDKLEAANLTGWVSFSVRYGYTKVSDFARGTKHWPAVPGRLWELLADPKGRP